MKVAPEYGPRYLGYFASSMQKDKSYLQRMLIEVIEETLQANIDGNQPAAESSHLALARMARAEISSGNFEDGMRLNRGSLRNAILARCRMFFSSTASD